MQYATLSLTAKSSTLGGVTDLRTGNLSNRGRRLDHIWVTPKLKNKIAAATVFNDARDWLKPSDHVPVIVDINI